MSRRKQRHGGPNAMDLVEEAVHLLRRAPVTCLGLYYVGAIPFMLGLLYFWADMSRSPFAFDRCPMAAVGLTLLYVWMRSWQAAFCRQLHAFNSGVPASPWTPRRWLRLAAVQLVLGVMSLYLLPLALLAMIPFAWVFAFHQNLAAMYANEDLTVRSAYRRALRHTLLWAYQNHSLISVLALFALFVFFSFMVTFITVPSLLKSLLGIQTRFTQSNYWVFNTTFFAVCFGVTYLCVDPLTKAAYVLRCFYGDSIKTGEDLLAILKTVRHAVARTVPLLAILLTCLLPFTGRAEHPERVAVRIDRAAGQTAASETRDAKLNASIEEVMTRREFTWRMPRAMGDQEREDKTLLGRFAEGTAAFFKKMLQALYDGLESFFDWLRRLLRLDPGPDVPDRSSSGHWMQVLQTMVWILLAVMLAVCIRLGWQMWRRRNQTVGAAELAAVEPVPDLEDENVIASQLPEDEWVLLAQGLERQGDFRKALRAYFLAGLAHLGHVELLRIAKSKSNLEYRRELERNARRVPTIPEFFARNVVTFERAWYGLHPVSREDLYGFVENLTRIKEHAPT